VPLFTRPSQHFAVYYIAAFTSHTALRAKRSRISSIDVAFSEEGAFTPAADKELRIKWTREQCALYRFIVRDVIKPRIGEKKIAWWYALAHSSAILQTIHA
jgi:hypothetical protein